MKQESDFGSKSEFIRYLSVISGIKSPTIASRLARGFTPEKAVSKPVTCKPDDDHPMRRTSYLRNKIRMERLNK